MNYDVNAKLNNQKFAIQKILSAAIVKIIVNYLQTITILKSLRLNWHEVWIQFFVVQETASGGVARALNLECLIEGFNQIFLF